MKVRRIVPLAGIASAAVIGLTACGFSGTSVAGKGAPAPDLTAQAQVPGMPAAPQPKVLQVTTQLPGFGPVVVSGRGRTVYRFDKDSNKPPTSSCFDDCAKTWQPIIVGSAGVALSGIEPRLLGTVHRPEGKQATLNGWPLYYYVNDVSFGQTGGQGVGGAWFAIAPDGSKARFTGAGPGASSPGGYTS